MPFTFSDCIQALECQIGSTTCTKYVQRFVGKVPWCTGTTSTGTADLNQQDRPIIACEKGGARARDHF